MITPAYSQLLFFFLVMLCGVCIGVMFDIYRIIRGFDSSGKILTMISDILFWILTALVTFIMLLYINNAQLQYNTFVALGMGVCIYLVFLSRIILTTLKWMVYYITKFFRMLFILFVYPLKLLRYFISFLIIKIKQLLRGGAAKLGAYQKNILNNYKKKKEKRIL